MQPHAGPSSGDSLWALSSANLDDPESISVFMVSPQIGDSCASVHTYEQTLGADQSIGTYSAFDTDSEYSSL